MMAAWPKQSRGLLPSPREPLRVVGAESAGVAGYCREKAPSTPSPPLRFATRGEGKR
jgi:hypothetical protein